MFGKWSQCYLHENIAKPEFVMTQYFAFEF